MKRLQLLSVTVALVTTSAGCSGGHSPTAPAGPDFISIASIAPPNGTSLARSSSVTITAMVNFQESCMPDAFAAEGEAGTISMTIKDQSGNLLSTEVKRTVRSGPGSATLSGQLNVPATGVSNVNVEFTLIPEALGCTLQQLFFPSTAASYPVGS